MDTQDERGETIEALEPSEGTINEPLRDPSERPDYSAFEEALAEEEAPTDYVPEVSDADVDKLSGRISDGRSTDEERDAEIYYNQLRNAEAILNKTKGEITESDYFTLSAAKSDMNIKFSKKDSGYKERVLSLVDKMFAGEFRGSGREALVERIAEAVRKEKERQEEANRIAKERAASLQPKPPIEAKKPGGVLGWFKMK